MLIEQRDRSENGDQAQIPFGNFLAAKSLLIAGLNEADAEYSAEFRGWRYSASFDSLVDMSVALAKKRSQLEGGSFDEDRYRRWQADYFETRVLSVQETKASGEHTDVLVELQGSDLDRSEKVGLLEEHIRLHEATLQFQDESKEALSPMSMARADISKRILYGLYDYLRGDIDHIEELYTFMNDPQFEPHRRENFVLLRRWAINNNKAKADGNLFTLSGKEVKDSESAQPSAHMFARFLRERGKKMRPDLKEWIGFVAKSGGMNLEDEAQFDDIAAYITPHAPFPRDLSAAYIGFVGETVDGYISGIKRGLSEFHPKLKSVPEIGPAEPNRKVKRDKTRSVAILNEVQYQVEDEPETEVDRIPHQIANIVDTQLQLLSDTDLTDYALNSAAKLAKNDQRMVSDVITILSELQKDPFGYGTAVLNHHMMSMGHKQLRLRTFALSRRPATPIQHEATQNVRAVYAIDSRTRTVLLHGIYGHNEYDRKFANRQS